MPAIEGKNIAIEKAKNALRKIDINERSILHGLPEFQKGKITFKAFGKEVQFHESDLRLVNIDTSGNVNINHYILFLHYLLSDIPYSISGQDISFRQLPGGQFYWEPFLSRTVKPLCQAIGNDLELLIKKLAKFEWEQEKYGDFSARIHTLGNIYILLIYHTGDDEFPARIDVLFDSNISRIYNAEDVAMLSSEICLGLLKP